MTRIDAAISIGLFGAVMLVCFLLAREAEGSKALASKLEVCNAKKPDAIRIHELETNAPQNILTSRPQRKNTGNEIEAPDMTTLRIGDTLIYASGGRGRVLSVTPMTECWRVATTRGRSCYAQYGTEVNGGENIKGVVR